MGFSVYVPKVKLKMRFYANLKEKKILGIKYEICVIYSINNILAWENNLFLNFSNSLLGTCWPFESLLSHLISKAKKEKNSLKPE